MPTVLPAGLMLAACLEREDPRDVFISRKASSLAELPQGATSGTASLRRQAIAKRAAAATCAWCRCAAMCETRLRKLDDGEVDATILALAGLKRLGLVEHATKIMSAEEFLPAVGQGAIGIEARADDARTRELLARIDHADTSTALACERAFLAVLDGSCKTPIGGSRRYFRRHDSLPRADRAAGRRRRARHRRNGPAQGCDHDRRRSWTRTQSEPRRTLG